MAYKISCSNCSSSAYEGETSLCLYERGKKHLIELASSLQSNYMVIHSKFHPDLITLNFRIEVLRQFRRIDETMRMKNSTATVLMNSGGAEWRQPAIPRAGFLAPGLEKMNL